MIAVVARTRADVDEVVDELVASGSRALALTADVRDLDSLPEVIDRTVAEFGGLDILVNNAGGEISPPFLDTRVDQHQGRDPLQRAGAVRAVPLGGATPARASGSVDPQHQLADDARLGARLAWPTTRQDRGVAAHALDGGRLGPRIRVNALLPGPIETEALRRYFDEKDGSLRHSLAEHTRLKRLGTPDDVASAAIFLSSPAASWITGLLMELTGGTIDEITPVYPDL